MSRTAKTIGFSLSPKMKQELEKTAEDQGMTKSEFFREMFRVYKEHLEEKEFEKLQRYGIRKAQEAGIRSEEDVARLVHESRGIKH